MENTQTNEFPYTRERDGRIEKSIDGVNWFNLTEPLIELNNN